MTSTAERDPVASRPRLIAARALTVLAVALVFVSVLANFVKREALDESQFRSTSRELIANRAVRDEVAITLVDQLYANVDVSALIGRRLPENLRPLSGLIAGAARDATDRSARRLLEQPRVQDVFVGASSHAQRQFVAVLDGDTRAVQTSGGKVVLDVRPLILDLGDRFSIVTNLQSRIPENAGKVTILESDQLKTAQDATRLLRYVANWIWVLALAAAAGAVWLARGRRRIELRANAIGLLIAGVLILMVQSLAGRYVVGHLVPSESVRPAASAAYGIITRLLRGAGWTVIVAAVVALVGIWLSGPGQWATEARQELAPYLRRAELAYGALRHRLSPASLVAADAAVRLPARGRDLVRARADRDGGAPSPDRPRVPRRGAQGSVRGLPRGCRESGSARRDRQRRERARAVGRAPAPGLARRGRVHDREGPAARSADGHNVIRRGSQDPLEA